MSELSNLIQELNSDQGSSFQATFSNNFVNDSLRFYTRIQQYYNNIPVTGGGYTANFIRTNSGDPEDPCAKLFSINLRILSGINLNTNPTIQQSSIGNILNIECYYNSELVIIHNFNNTCEYKLVYRVNYFSSFHNYMALIDAHNGQILINKISDEYINAPTATYGHKILNDLTISGTTYLKNPNGRLRVLDFDSGGDITLFTTWRDKPTPTTNNTEWTTEASVHAFQALFLGKEILTQMDGLGIGSFFSNVVIGTNSVSRVAQAMKWPGFSDKDLQAVFLGGNVGGASGVLPDLMGHELIHIYLRPFLKSDKNAAGSLHEGIADILGTYLEYKFQNNTIDWGICDDEPNAEGVYDRNLQFPQDDADCYSEVKDITSSHKRGQPLGHWYYLITAGSTNPTIPALGPEKAIEILLASIPSLDDNSDYQDLMKASIDYVLKKYGRCSAEFKSVAQAWEKICIITGYADSNNSIPECSVRICSDNNICEEWDQFSICICTPYPAGSIFNWTIIGPKSTEYSSNFGMIGNSQNGGLCLSINNIPKYPYYPQYIKVRCYSPTMITLGIKPYIDEILIKIEDCDGQDPNCTSYNPNTNLIDKQDSILEHFIYNYYNENQYLVKYYNILGEEIKSGQEINNYANGIAIEITFDQNGKIIESRKLFLHNR